MPAKTLVVIVTRNNPVLLTHVIEKHLAFNPGAPCDYLIADACSTDSHQYAVLKEQQLGKVVNLANDRVEVSFNACYKLYPDYDYYFFCHDDNVPVAQNWLAPFHQKLSFFDDRAPKEYAHLPVGRVCALTHFWRGYQHVMNYPVQCSFLKPCIETITGESAPNQFKYGDCDRALVTRQCLEATNGLVTLQTYATPQIVSILDRHINHFDPGMYPKEQYPVGMGWHKLTVLSEFMNSVLPLLRGFRTVGVTGRGYLEQLHGRNVPWGNRFIAHYGSPNTMRALSQHFGVTTDEIKKKMNDSIFLMQAHRILLRYEENI